MENPEEVLQTLDEFTKLKPKDIPKELEDYLSYVAKTGDPVYQWSLVKSLFREKLLNVITDFYEGCPSVELPPCPNVDTFNYDTMKDRLIERLELFASAPFTVQRLCELLTSPKKQYSRADKFMRAVEKNIMVVSTREPGQIRRNDSSQPELVNGVADTAGLEHEPGRVNLDGLGLTDSNAISPSSFLSTEGSVQIMFDDAAVEKNNSPTKSYDEGYEVCVPRRASGWFRDRVESTEKISPFGTPIHSSHVSARINEETDVDVENQLAEKYGPVAESGIVEEDEEDIEDDYVEPTQNVAHFHSQEPNPTLLGLESAEDYCCPPSPEEENSETCDAVSTIAEEISNPLSDTSILEEGDSAPNIVILPGEDTKDSLNSSVSDSEIQAETESPIIKIINVPLDRKEENSVAVELIDETTICISTTVAETLIVDSECDKTSNTGTKTDSLEADSMDVNATSSEPVSSEATDSEPSKGESETIDEIAVSKSKSPEPTSVEEPVECELIIGPTDGKAEESPELTVNVDSVECVSVEQSGPIKSETVEMTVIETSNDSLKPIVAPEESLDVPATVVVAVEEVKSTSELQSAASSDPTPEGPTKITAAQDEVETVPELPDEVSAEVKTKTVRELPEETSESVPSVEEERDREMMIQNERVESVIQENVEQSPLQEEILMQQIFVSSEIPMDEKTSECEPEAMEVDETSQTVEEPMEQGDVSPNIS